MVTILDSRYGVDGNGCVINMETGKILKQKTSKLGYKIVCLYINKKKKFFYVHRLVSVAYIENKKSHPEVNHIDGNPGNNKHTNLEWCTSSHNSLHAHRTGLQETTILFGNKNGMYKGEIIAENKITKERFTIRALTECSKFGFNAGRVGQVINGKEKSHKGYIFWRKK